MNSFYIKNVLLIISLIILSFVFQENAYGQEQCLGGINASSYSFPAGGGSNSFTVWRYNSECTDYSAWANDGWLSVSVDYSSSTIYFTASANTGSARSTVINVVDYGTGYYWYVYVDQPCGLPPAPTSATSNRTSICSYEGGTITLTASGGSGTTLRWLSGGCTGSTVGTGNPLTISAPTSTTTYYARWENGCGSSPCASVTVTVRSAPSAVAYNDGAVCAGGNLSLHANGGSSYSWTGPNGFTSQIADPVISYASESASGTYYVTVSNGYCSAQVSTTGTVRPLPVATVTSNSPVCAGSALNISTGSASTYLWTDPHGYTSTTQSISTSNATSANQGGYTVVVTDQYGCSSSGWGYVTVNPLPSASATSNSPRCQGASLQLYSSGGQSYRWTGPNSFYSEQQNPVISSASTQASGIYYVAVTNSSGCSSQASVNVSVNALPTITITGPASACQSSTGNVYTTQAGMSSYTWIVTGGTITSGGQTWENTATITWGSGGTGHVTVNYTNSNGCRNAVPADKSVSIIPLPSTPSLASSNRNNLCYGDAGTITLTASGGSGATVRWLTGGCYGTSIGTINPLVITAPTTTTTYYVRWENACGSSTCASITVTVYPQLTGGGIAGDQTICYGDDAGLVASSSGAGGGSNSYQYSWEYSINGGSTWINAGSTQTTFDPPALITTTNYRRKVTDAVCNNSLYTGSVTKTVRLPLDGGYIGSHQEICYNDDPELITSITLADNGSGSYSYSWEKSVNEGSTWQNADGSLTQYDPGNLTLTTYYRRKATDNNYSCNGYSNNVIINVDLQLTAGTISGAETICYGADAGNISGTVAGGGSGVYTYTWEYSENGGVNWLNAPVSGTDYNPSNLLTTTLFRRKITDDQCLDIAYSENVTKTVRVATYAGTITGAQTIFYDTDAGLISSMESASGGTGSFSYQWQSDNGSSTWSDITGATALDYNPGNLIISTKFHRKAIDSGNGCIFTSNDVPATVTVFGFPDNEKNYIYVREPRVAANDLDEISHPDDYTSSIQYFDGLGRPAQTIQILATPAHSDIVTPFDYDEFGRETVKYLPYAQQENRGAFVENSISSQGAFYDASGYYPNEPAFSETVFEDSPLNRVTEQGTPGAAWQVVRGTSGESDRSGHTIRYEYGTNGNDVYMWTCDETNHQPRAISPNVKYGINTLYRVRTYDENADTTSNTHWTEEYKDKLGNIVLKRVFDGTSQMNTYYVYDDFGLLRYVLPPAVSITAESSDFIITSAELDKYCYTYSYDSRRRMITKKLPGADPVYMVYDKRDRLVAVQDGKMRQEDANWLFTKYDMLNRPVVTGKYYPGSAISQSQMQDTVDDYYDDPTNLYYTSRTNLQANMGYDLNSFPEIGITYYTATYYDTYGYYGVKAFNATVNISGYSDNSGNTSYFDNVKSLVTGTKVLVLDGGSTYLYATTYYDDKYRPIEVINDLYDGAAGVQATGNKYDFIGQVTESKISQTFNNATKTLSRFYTYDHTGRLLKTEQEIGGDIRVTLASMEYNELGQLAGKDLHKVGAANPLQNVDYKYNIRGWLTGINDPDNLGGDLFAMSLYYNDATGISPLTTEAQFNGNISGIRWKSGKLSDSPLIKGYGFTYDNINRFMSSDYGEGTSFATNPDRYNESIGSYDANGNIGSLSRRGIIRDTIYTSLDVLTYNYNGNRLTGVDDSGTGLRGFINLHPYSVVDPDYSYDKNGNLIQDLNKGINTINYNYINLPSSVIKDASNKVEYVYDAGGVKLKKRATIGASATDRYYAGAFEYGPNKALELIHTDEGVVNYSGTIYTYEYFLKDHLGNTRIAFKPESGSTTITQYADYYPFGMSHGSNRSIGFTNKYQYNGKELQDELLGVVNLNWYDYGARMYDPQIGRFTGLDPIAEKFYYVTPYNYAENDPVGSIDLWGLQKLRIAGNFSLTTGKVGAKAVISDIAGIGGSYTKGGASQTVEIYLEVNTETGKVNVGISHSQKSIAEGSSFDIGTFHGSESSEKETKRDLSIRDGATKTEDKTYKDKISGGVKALSTEETEESKAVKTEAKVEVNAGLVGVEAGVSIQYSQENKKPSNTSTTTMEKKIDEEKQKKNN